MEKIIVAAAFLSAAMNAMAFGELGQWSSGWGQGVSEYTAVASKGNELYIACSDDAPVTMTLTVTGVEYGSNSTNGFDLVIDGKEIQTPYNTSSRVGADNFSYAWIALRKAKKLQAKTSDGKELTLPTKGVAKALPASGVSEFNCKADF
jgi:hypothetical protein